MIFIIFICFVRRQYFVYIFILGVKRKGGARAAGKIILWVGTPMIRGMPEEVVCSYNLKQSGRLPLALIKRELLVSCSANW